MAGGPMGGGQPQATGQNPYQQSAGAYNNALNITGQAVNAAANMPVSLVEPTSYEAQMMERARDVTAGQFAGTDISPYMNPYTNQVVDQTAADMERARLVQQNQADDAMQAAGAFGGSRHGIANAETNRGFYDRLGATTGALRHQGYQNAQNAAFQDIGNTMNADLANQGADLTTNQFNAGAENTARQYNATNAMTANLTNAAAQNTAGQNQFNNLLSGASAFSGLADQGFGFGQDITNQQMRQGALTRGLQQQTIDAARQQFGNYTNAGNLGLSPLAGFVSGNYGGTQTQTKNPGLMGMIGSGVSSLQGLHKMGGLAGVGAMFCWVAREVYGPTNPEWLDFREWMLTKAPAWLRKAYIKHGPKIAEWVARNPWSKHVLRPVMDWLKG